MGKGGPQRVIDYRPALYSIRNAIHLHSLVLVTGIEQYMANAERLNAAVQGVVAGVAALVDAVRNPAADGDQAAFDAAADQLEAAIDALNEGLAAEQTEDGAVAEEPAE